MCLVIAAFLFCPQGKSNFFERRVGEYQRAGVMTVNDFVFTTDEDFWLALEDAFLAAFHLTSTKDVGKKLIVSDWKLSLLVLCGMLISGVDGVKKSELFVKGKLSPLLEM